MDEPTIPADAQFRIQLPTFEGPLDLLLHLIRKHELPILDLPISFVTERYLEYLGMMRELDLDVASEYLLMAATLAHIKSKMLLPPSPLDQPDEPDEVYLGDPREELIRRLLEYQKYRAAAEELGARPLEGRDVFARGMPAPEAQGPAPLAQIEIYKLLDAFQGILKRVKGRVALEVSAERITIHERISQLADLLRSKRECTFEELFEGDRTRYEVVVTFMALLEMTKLRMTRIYQSDPASPLHVQYALLDADAPTIPPASERGPREPFVPSDTEPQAHPDVEAESPDVAALASQAEEESLASPTEGTVAAETTDDAEATGVAEATDTTEVTDAADAADTVPAPMAPDDTAGELRPTSTEPATQALIDETDL
ncbi:MAG TPA: segregation/condensation protein A [Polyangiales bacterium]